MTVSPTEYSENVVAGPCKIYTGAFGATEPTDLLVATVPASGAWTSIGWTEGGVKITAGYKYNQYSVDQVDLPVTSRATVQEFTVTTLLAETTVEALKAASNNAGTITTGTGFKAFDPSALDGGSVPGFFAIILDGYAPTDATLTSYRRRLIVRKVLNIEPVAFANEKDKIRTYSVKFAAHYVSGAILPYHLVDGTA